MFVTPGNVDGVVRIYSKYIPKNGTFELSDIWSSVTEKESTN